MRVCIRAFLVCLDQDFINTFGRIKEKSPDFSNRQPLLYGFDIRTFSLYYLLNDAYTYAHLESKLHLIFATNKFFALLLGKWHELSILIPRIFPLLQVLLFSFYCF